MESDTWKDVASIVESDKAQVPVDRRWEGDWHRNSQLRVDDQKLAATIGHLNLSARTRNSGVAADWDISLLPGAVQREPAQSASATGEKQFAGWNAASGKGLCQSYAEAICPD